MRTLKDVQWIKTKRPSLNANYVTMTVVMKDGREIDFRVEQHQDFETRMISFINSIDKRLMV